MKAFYILKNQSFLQFEGDIEKIFNSESKIDQILLVVSQK